MNFIYSKGKDQPLTFRKQKKTNERRGDTVFLVFVVVVVCFGLLFCFVFFKMGCIKDLAFSEASFCYFTVIEDKSA